MLRKTHAQAISQILRRNGFNPHSTNNSRKRWVALLCVKSDDEVRVRVWSNPIDPTPDAEDRKTAAEIASLLTSQGYKIRYEPGEYYLYVAGKEV